MNPSDRLIQPLPLSTPRAALRIFRRTRPKLAGTTLVDISIPALWRETIAIFSAHSGAVLACAMIGFASVSIVARSFRLFTRTGPNSSLWPLAFCAALGWLLNGMAQGAIAWIGLWGENCHTGQGGHVGPTLRGAVRVALSRWRVLLPGSLIHSALTFVCALGGTALFIIGGLALSDRTPSQPDLDAVSQSVAAHSIDAALLGPQHPYSELIAPARYGLLRLIWQPGSSAPVELKWLAYSMSAPTSVPDSSVRREPWVMLPLWLIALATMALVILTEPMLRFWPAAAMRKCVAVRAGSCLAPIVESVRLGWRYFGLVTASAWVMRLAVSAMQVAGVILPLAVADNVILPEISQTVGAAWAAR